MEAIPYALVVVASIMETEFVACFEATIQANLAAKLYFRTWNWNCRQYCQTIENVLFPYALVVVASTMEAEFVACFETTIQANLAAELYFRAWNWNCRQYCQTVENVL